MVLLWSSSQADQAGEKTGRPIRGNSLHHVYIPPGFTLTSPKKVRFTDGGLIIDISSKDFSQGNAAYVEISSKESAACSVTRMTFDGAAVLLTRASWGYRGFFAISPDTIPGDKTVTVLYSQDGLVRGKKFTLPVKKTGFAVYTSPLDLGKFSDTRKRTPEEIRFINESQEKKNRAFTSRNEDLVESILSHPRDIHYVTSPFWSKRVYMNYRIKNGGKVMEKSSSNIHKGVDLKGETGTPVFSLASGKVVLAEELYYEGFMVIINHGNEMISYFMHMSTVKVKKDDMVKAGDVIGLVGSTGVSTAAHLHVSFIIRGIQVDPLSILHLPVRDLNAGMNN